MVTSARIGIGLLALMLGDAAIAAAAERPVWLQPSSPRDDGEPDWLRRIARGQDSVYDEPLVTDRPDFTEASSTVGRGVLQLEMGYTFVRDNNEVDGSKVRAHNTPETLFRYGLTDEVELRLYWNYVWQRTVVGGVAESLDGAEDFSVGAKIELLTECGWRPEMAVIVDLGAPTGGSVFSTENVEVGAIFQYSWSLPRDWSLAGSTGYSTSSELASVTIPPLTTVDFQDRHNIWIQSVALGVPLTEKVGCYIEYFGLYTDGLASDFPSHFIDGGFTYLVNNNTQFDIRAGHGLNDRSADFFGGVGLSQRF